MKKIFPLIIIFSSIFINCLYSCEYRIENCNPSFGEPAIYKTRLVSNYNTDEVRAQFDHAYIYRNSSIDCSKKPCPIRFAMEFFKLEKKNDITRLLLMSSENKNSFGSLITLVIDPQSPGIYLTPGRISYLPSETTIKSVHFGRENNLTSAYGDFPHLAEHTVNNASLNDDTVSQPSTLATVISFLKTRWFKNN